MLRFLTQPTVSSCWTIHVVFPIKSLPQHHQISTGKCQDAADCPGASDHCSVLMCRQTAITTLSTLTTITPSPGSVDWGQPQDLGVGVSSFCTSGGKGEILHHAF